MGRKSTRFISNCYDPYDVGRANRRKKDGTVAENDRYCSKIDLSKGFWRIPVPQEDFPKMAFVIMDRHCELLRMPFGMMNSGATLICAVKMLVNEG
ncbi:retrovirus-related pol polyprotein from transposon opus [Plakobranchus ocellatus]|uniref:Retrovirus-related pol polyprotein from transposon opus n=1 Tax=Plakobranchus ocellatus TaxID=259542 RepID=A0AAV3ZLV4_9GAST|nr:retrovirus-related pol polyprotein from transposon opus [Plakobranchus ocellatus]